MTVPAPAATSSTRAHVRKTVVGTAIAVLGWALFASQPAWSSPARLLDGITAPSSYRFVDPPPFFAAGNVPPGDVSRTIALRAYGSAPAGLATPDGQFVVDLARGAIAPRPGATSVIAKITPVAPKQLAAVAAPARANGNAYRLELTYQPGGEPVTGFARSGSLLIETPELASAVLHSADGTAWTAIPARTVASNGLSMSAELAAPGDYLATTTLPELAAAPTASNRSHTSAVVIGVVVVAVAVALIGVGFALIRRRRRAGTSA